MRWKLLTLILCVVSVNPAILRSDPLRVTVDVREGGALIRSPLRLPACFTTPTALVAGTYCAERTASKSYAVFPPFPITGMLTITLEAVPSLIFADGFESWQDGGATISPWSSARGLRSDPHMIRGGHWYPVGHLHSAAGNDYLISTVMGDSASGDTPASTPYRPYLEPGELVDWSVYETSDGWLDVGGVVRHREIVFTARNRRDPFTNVGPLDDMIGETFEGEEFILYAIDPAVAANGIGLVAGTIASGTKPFRGTVIDASFSGELQDQFTWTVREQTAEGLSVPTTPFALYGAGTGVKVEDGGSYGAGARISRADDANLRGTGSQWFAWALAQFGQDKVIPVPASEYTFWESPICRLRKDPSSGGTYGGVKVQLLDSASSWTTVVASQNLEKDKFTTFLVNYDSAATSAELFVDGTSVGSTTISGGLKAAASGTAEWYANPNQGTGGWTHYWFRHGTRKLAAAEITDRGVYAFDFASESNLTAAIEFVEATGTIASDYAALANGTGTPAVLTSFADANGAWQESALGNLTQARVRPPAIIGRPFMAKMMCVGVAQGVYTAGYNAGGAANTRRVVADGVRLKPTPYPSSHSVTFRTTGKEIDGVQLSTEPAIGQVLTWTGDSDATNDGNYTVTKILIDPRTYNYSDTQTATIAVAETFTAGTIAGVWTTVDTPDWAEYSAGPSDAIFLSSIQISSGATDHLAQGMGSSATEKLIQDALESFGPQVTPTLTNLASVGIKDYGWQGDGELLALQAIDTLARVTPSADYSPTVVYRSAAAAWQARGMDAAPSTADFTLDEVQIRSATVKSVAAKYDSVRVRYAQAWSEVPPGLVSSLNTDALPQEAAHKFREVTSGTGSRELVVEAYFLHRSDAQSFADQLLAIITTGRLYKIDVYGPITKELAVAEPFDVFDITWSADSFLSAGRKGTLVGWKVESDGNSATATILFIP